MENLEQEVRAAGEDFLAISASSFVVPEGYQGGKGYLGWPRPGQPMPLEVPAEMLASAVNGLMRLRDQFAPDQIEKLPKPKWRGAWDDERGSQCDECNGYHVTSNCIHLDYVGHANATNRLLDADLTWNWEPMAYTENGTPLFCDGGLWIYLTVCGVTRIGFGDGKSIKEVIGDAIRNAAMRFGVALDLWAKINLHEERNPGDGQTQGRAVRGQGGGNAGGRRGSGQAPGPERGGDVATDSPRAANQDALDALAVVCDQEGFDRGTMGSLYEAFAKRVGKGNLRLIDAPDASIREFTVDLVERAFATRDGDGATESGSGVAVANTDAPTGDTDLAGEQPVGRDGQDSAGAPGVPAADDPETIF